MAKRRKKGGNPVPMYIGIGALAILLLIAISNPWSILSIVFILLLIGTVVLWMFYLWQKIDRELEKTRKFDRVKSVQSIANMAFLSPKDFENYVATIYERLGYTATVTQYSGDAGIDIILKNKSEKVGVQVKRYLKGSVGRPEIQKLVGASLNIYDRMIFVTTSYFTPDAYEYAAGHNIELVNGEKLTEMAKLVFGEKYVEKALMDSLLQKN